MMRDLADTFIEKLESGDFGAWKKSWASVGMDAIPHNVRGTSYRGINTVILWLSGFDYKSPQWGTYDQWKKLSQKHAISKGEFTLESGRKGPWKKTTKWYGVKKGELGTTVIFWKPQTYKKNEGTDEEEERVSFILKTYTVFNRDQTELPPLPQVEGSEFEAKEFNDMERDFNDALHHYRRTTKGAEVKLKHGGNRAFYTSSADRIAMPERKQFESNLHYLSVLGHECIHSTGHALRMNRPLGNGFGSKEYAFEELIAELGSAFLMGAFGLSGDMRHTEYLASWIRILKDKPEALMEAASKAQKATDFIIDPYVEHSRIRGPDEDPCACKQCETLAELRNATAWVLPLATFFESFEPVEVPPRNCPHGSVIQQLDGDLCQWCGAHSGDEEE